MSYGSTKEIAKKANKGDEEALQLLVIALPSGTDTDPDTLKAKAKEMSGEEEPDTEEEPEVKDPDLKDSILASLSDIDLDEDQLKAVCKAIYKGLESGEIDHGKHTDDEDE